MFRYYQLSEFDTWKIRADDNPTEPWKFAEEHKAIRVSVLCVSVDIDMLQPDGTVDYAGPLFFDIDDHDLDLAIKSANLLCKKLMALGVAEDDIEIHLSGSKGVHIYLNPCVYSDGAPCQSLSEIHAKMAMHLWVDGVDFQVYSDSKGRLVRPPNALRPDGRYKVPISLTELQELDSDTYLEYVANRREFKIDRPLKKAVDAIKDSKGDVVRLTIQRNVTIWRMQGI